MTGRLGVLPKIINNINNIRIKLVCRSRPDDRFVKKAVNGVLELVATNVLLVSKRMDRTRSQQAVLNKWIS